MQHIRKFLEYGRGQKDLRGLTRIPSTHMQRVGLSSVRRAFLIFGNSTP